MLLKADVVVQGMKRSKGESEQFGAYDSTRIFVEDTLGANDPDTRGTATVSYKIGDSSEFERYANLPFPIRAQIEIESVANGRGGTRSEIRSFKPILPTDKKAA